MPQRSRLCDLCAPLCVIELAFIDLNAGFVTVIDARLPGLFQPPVDDDRLETCLLLALSAE
jgi:hypothetical protein